MEILTLQVSGIIFYSNAGYGRQGCNIRWFGKNAADDVAIENISDLCTGFQIARPNVTALLKKVAYDTNETMHFLDLRHMVIETIECLVQKVSNTDDLGYEIFCRHMDRTALS